MYIYEVVYFVIVYCLFCIVVNVDSCSGHYFVTVPFYGAPTCAWFYTLVKFIPN